MFRLALMQGVTGDTVPSVTIAGESAGPEPESSVPNHHPASKRFARNAKTTVLDGSCRRWPWLEGAAMIFDFAGSLHPGSGKGQDP